MKRNQTMIAVLLTILALGFIVFVAFMQNNFNNPEFDQLSVTTTGNTDTSDDDVEEEEQVDDDSVAGAAGSVVGEEEEDVENDADTADSDTDEADSDEEQNDVITSTQTVEAETLNAREGPGIDYQITGVLEAGQVVTVEDSGDDWVKIITSEFEGYVNKNYLSGE